MNHLLFSKRSFLLLFSLIILISCSSSEDENKEDVDDTLLPIPNTNYDITPILTLFDNIEAVSYSVNGNTVTFTTTDLPNHTSPYWNSSHPLYEAYNGTNSNWNQNPNSIGEQNITFTMSLNPSESLIKKATPLGPIGIARNGVVFFNQYAGRNNQPLTNEIEILLING